ncbi:transcriptional initiation protein Tat [Halopelagius fulvigenes]|uniref:Transcriptional initiation protein Tat n=1 Tax=Halopelagius fulvigenes TaxID=1198324 RepID=A0ABD5TWG9_9EURY
MVPDPTLTRRRLLAGAGATAGAALLGAGAVAPEWLPDALTDRLVVHAAEPPNHLWRQTVTDEHADEAVAALESAVERAKQSRSRVTLSEVSDDLRHYLNHSPSGGWVESARTESDNWTRLFNATYGLQFAGEAIGYARVALGEADPEALVERGRTLRSDAEEVRDSVSDYRVSDPGRDLAGLYAVERSLSFAKSNSYWSGTYTGGEADVSEYSEHGLVSTWGSQLQAEQYLRDARHYRERYRETLGEGARSYADELDAALKSLRSDVEQFPTHREMRERLETDDVGQATPYGVVRWRLTRTCFDEDFRFDADGYRAKHAVERLVRLARALLDRRAHEYAVGELGVSPDDSDYDAGRALTAKRAAMRTFRRVRRTRNSPFESVLAEESANRIRAGDIGLESAFRDGDRPAWRPRVEASVSFLVGEGGMRELGDVAGAVLE